MVHQWTPTPKSVFSTEDDYSLELLKQKNTCRKTTTRSVVALFICMLIAFIIIWVVLPVSFKLSLPFQTFMVFVPIDSPRNPDFNKPEDFGLQGVHNFYIPTRDYYDNNTWTSIGAWLLLPDDEVNSTIGNNTTEILRNTIHDVLIYLHGVAANRAKALEQYRVLRKHFLIIAIDHRGYGDSGRNVRMSEAGITNDHVQIYDWVSSVNPEHSIYYWGHSLGSGLSARTLKLLKEQRGVTPKGLVLESAFTSLQDELVNIVIGRIYKWLPYFDATILTPINQNGFHFRTSDNILSIDCPVMILHAEDDLIIPYFLGEELSKIAKKNRRSDQGNVLFHGISADYGFGHNDIVLHPQMESAFTSLQDKLVNIVIGRIYKWLPYFDATILTPINQNGFHFRTSDNILSIDCPVMILHAEDDLIIPYFLGEELSKIAKKNRRSDQGSVLFHGISADYGFGHNDIVLHPQMGEFIDNFKTICRNFSSNS